jgi:uncharacterized protein
VRGAVSNLGRVPWRAGLLAAGLGLGLTIFACQSGAAEAGGPGLWRATGPKGSLHVMGSIHILTETDNWIDRPIEKAFRNSECLALEIDLAAHSRDEINEAFRVVGLYDDGSGGLDAHVSEATYARFVRASADLSIAPESLNSFEPWFVGLLLNTSVTHSLGYSDAYGVEQIFLKMALETRKPVLGLETLTDQVAVLSDNAGETDDQILSEALDAVTRLPQLTKIVAEAWRHGDMDTIGRTVADEFADHPGEYDRLIGRRNRAWLPHLEEMLETGRHCMVVVGAGHLVGESSLLTLLENAGYAVTRE